MSINFVKLSCHSYPDPGMARDKVTSNVSHPFFMTFVDEQPQHLRENL